MKGHFLTDRSQQVCLDMDTEIISREKARDHGLKFYFTGKPCKRGHTCERYVSNGKCKVCKNTINAKYRQENRQKLRDKQLKYCRDNHEQVLERKRKYRQENRQKLRDKQLKYCRDNHEQVLERKRKHYQNNKSTYLAYGASRRARKNNATPDWLTDEQKVYMASFYALCPPGHHVDHIVPLKGSNICGLHVPWNLQILTAEENIKKGNRLDV